MSQLLLNKTKGYHSYTPEMLKCQSCGQQNITTVNRKNHVKRFCEDCLVIRKRIKSLERYHARKNK